MEGEKLEKVRVSQRGDKPKVQFNIFESSSFFLQPFHVLTSRENATVISPVNSSVIREEEELWEGEKRKREDWRGGWYGGVGGCWSGTQCLKEAVSDKKTTDEKISDRFQRFFPASLECFQPPCRLVWKRSTLEATWDAPFIWIFPPAFLKIDLTISNNFCKTVCFYLFLEPLRWRRVTSLCHTATRLPRYFVWWLFLADDF